MPRRRSHYERAFEGYLERRRAPFALLSDARRVALGDADRLPAPTLRPNEFASLAERGVQPGGRRTLKSFDLIVYAEPAHALLDVKGRKVSANLETTTSPRLENWVTEDDIESLLIWETLFGAGYEAAFAFVYWCESRPPAALFDDAFEHHGRWYGVRAARLSDYRGAMRQRSARWRTVHVAQDAFERLSRPLLG
jgi:hypothetical protein